MICRYETPDFKTLQVTLYDFLDKKSNDATIIGEKRNLSSILSEAINKANIDRLYKLDKLNLTYNSWSSNDRAMNENLLASCNIVLLKIIHGEKIETFSFDSIIESIYITLYADFYEASLIITEFHDKKFFEDIISKLNYYIEQLSPETVKRLNYLWFEIPKNVFTVHLNQHLEPKVLETVKSLQENEVFLSKKTIENEKLLSDIAVIRSSLDEQKYAYNFLGLSAGFSKLKGAKEAELKTEKETYKNLMITIIAIIFIKTIGSLVYLWSNDPINSIFIAITIATVFFLFVLLYFFRISLINVKSIKSQILQIDLRLTLCQFIHNYDSNTKDLREGMKESFGKFESVIFSPLVATEDQMPSTFDGLEQLTGMIGLFNKKPD